MTNNTLTCTKCHTPLPQERFNTLKMTACPSCGAALRIDVFPAFFKGITPGKVGEELLIADEAGCFYHPEKKAIIPCDHCGRFLCALCDVELNGRHLCPNCLETGKEKGKLKSLETHRTLYDAIAFWLAVYPIVFVLLWFISIVTAPISLYIAIRYWNASASLVPRTKIRSIAAIVLSGLQILGWGLGIYYLIVG